MAIDTPQIRPTTRNQCRQWSVSMITDSRTSIEKVATSGIIIGRYTDRRSSDLKPTRSVSATSR